ncbi:thymic stromal cotransporter homolog [Synchiropus splendidus]|uniref:thymic stromal cotransporter homolog n=1 Tax=Synchiropus splendidus TaxID=270530 RepID=UPI00237EAFF6|nr:thymic stromal cotransporter homolog [Synchiropus splendidus]
MVIPSLCEAARSLLRRIWPVIVLHQLSFTLFQTALQMVVKDRCDNSSDPDRGSREDRQQRAMADFFMIYNLIIQLVPVLPGLLLARASDRGWRRAPIVLPLCGYLVQTLGLLLVVAARLPLQVMFGAAALVGATGEFSVLWPGVMTLASLNSSAKDRSKELMTAELLYGLAGLVGSLVSGHLFLVYSQSLGGGTVLLIVSCLLFLTAIALSAALLQVQRASSEPEETTALITNVSPDVSTETSTGKNLINVVLLMSAGILYNSAVGGAVEMLAIFVLKEPLSWDATMVGYGNAFGGAIFITSFIAVVIFRRCASDTTLILIGMISFATGIYFMSFVTSTTMFFVARSINMLALIPMPTIRSMLSQQVPESSLSVTLTLLQIILRLAGLAYVPAFTRIYQNTLDWYPGFVFMLASMLTVLAMIPVSIVGCRPSLKRRRHTAPEE